MKWRLSNLPGADSKTLVIRMLKELSEDLSSIKKIQSDLEKFQHPNYRGARRRGRTKN